MRFSLSAGRAEVYLTCPVIGIEVLGALLVALLVALGARLAYFDNVPERPGWLHRGLTRRRRGVLVEYPPGIARLAGVALLLYGLGLTLITVNIVFVLSNSNPPRWTAYGGWPLLIGVLLSIYVMLRLRHAPPPPAE